MTNYAASQPVRTRQPSWQTRAGALLELRRRGKAVSFDSYAAFQNRYFSDLAGFVQDCFTWSEGEAPAPYQIEALSCLHEAGRYAIRGPHGLGKTALAAWIVLHFALTRDGRDWKAATTASAWRQLSKFLWPEIHKWARRLRWEKIGREPFRRDELLTLSLRLETGEAFASTSDNPETMEGLHADHVLYVFDEAKIIPAETFDAVEGAFAGASAGREAYALAVSTPGEPLGRFYEIHARGPGFEDWTTRHVRLEEALSAGRVAPSWVEARRRQWGEESALFQNRVLGEFASSDEAGVIPLAWVEAAQERYRQWQDAGGEKPPLDTLGLDVADGGPDDSVLALKFGHVIEIRVLPKCNPMVTTGYASAALSKHPAALAIVDTIGVGAGVAARLRELSYNVASFIASLRTDTKDATGEFGFADLRSAAWWALREALDPLGGQDLALMDDDRLTGDLVAPRWTVRSGGKIKVESKDSSQDEPKGGIRKRLGRSTDCADAVVQAMSRHLFKPAVSVVRIGNHTITLS